MDAGQAFYVVVDSSDSQSANFTLQIACVPVDESDCNDGLDNDADGLVDCEDDDCWGDACRADTEAVVLSGELALAASSSVSFAHVSVHTRASRENIL